MMFNRNSIGNLFQVVTGRVRKFLGANQKSGKPVRLFLMAAASIFILVAIFWFVDKIVLYFLTEIYVDQLAEVFDLNDHLKTALLVATFVTAAVFTRHVWSFSKKRRLIGITGIAAMLIGHSVALWYGTRDNVFNRRGEPNKCYVLTRDGKVTYSEHPGIDPVTGRQCRKITAEILERLKQYEAGKRPQRIINSNPVFFDPRSGEPIVWYSLTKDHGIEIFDLNGFNPDTGEVLLPITEQIAGEWKKQIANGRRCVPRLIGDPDTYVFFDPRNGEPRAWYWVEDSGQYEFYDCPGFQPQTGGKLEVVTREILSRWKENESRPSVPTKVPNRVEIAKDTVFFDPISGNPRLWYWRRDKGDYDFFDGPGFHPQNGEPLKPFRTELLTQYRQEIADKAKQLKADQDRIEAEQKAKKEAEEKRQRDQQQKEQADQLKRSRATEAARQCDELAANPSDSRRVGAGVPYGALKPQAADAVTACELAANQNPTELRFKYQLGRALEVTGDGAVQMKNRGRAFGIHQSLVKAGYAAAFDNLGSLYRWDRRDLATAARLFRKGAQLGDSDSIMSLADLIERGEAMPEGPNEEPLQLYKRAAELGDANGARAYQEELGKAQEERLQQLQQQRITTQFMGTILRNIH